MARSIAQAPWPHPLLSATSLQAEQPALLWQQHVLTYRQLLEQVQHTAAILQQHGVQPGMVIGLHGPPTLDWIVTLHTLGWLGAIACPLPWSPSPPSSPAPAAATLLAQLEHVERVLCAPASCLTAHRKAMPWWSAAQRWPLQAQSPLTAHAQITMETPWLLLHSSGTSGIIKPVCHTFGALWLANAQSVLRLGHRRYDRWLAVLPLHFTGGISVLLRALLTGTSVQLQLPFVASEAAALIDSGSIHLLSLVPLMLQAVLDARSEQSFPGAVRAVLVGGAPLPAALRARARTMAIPIAPTWGMTETAAQIATLPPEEAAWCEQGVGPALACNQVWLEGERLCVDGPIVSEPLRTNDVGHIDQLGHIHVLARMDDVLLYGGQTILPSVLEQPWLTYPKIMLSLDLAWPHPKLHQVPLLVLLVDDHAGSKDPQWSIERLMAWAQQYGPANCVPRYVLLIPPKLWALIGQLVQGQAFVAKPDKVGLGKWRRQALLAWLQQHRLVCEQYILRGQPCAQWLGHGDGTLESRIGTTVDELHTGNQTPIAMGQLVPATETGSLGQHPEQTNGHGLTQPDRTKIIGVGVHQGRGPMALGKGLLQVGKDQSQQFLPSCMAVSKITCEIDNTSSIDIIETGGEGTRQWHGQDPGNGQLVHTPFAGANKPPCSSFSD